METTTTKNAIHIKLAIHTESMSASQSPLTTIGFK